jgi:predicted deacylase
VAEAGAAGAAAVAAVAAARPPIELKPPPIERWRDGGTGVDWVHAWDTGKPGPRVMIQALTHGNEICGAIALDWLLAQIHEGGFQPRCGRLILAFANVAAYRRFDAKHPFASRCIDEDLNRLWDDKVLLGDRDSAELRRARELRPFVDASEYLLDIHSMSEPCAPLMVCGTQDKNAAYARELGLPEVLLVDTGHPAGLRMVERGGFGDPHAKHRALLIECGWHWEAAAAVVAHEAVVRFLGLTGLADAAWMKAHVRGELPARQRVLRVTEAVVAKTNDFKFLVPTIGLSVIERAGTPIARDGETTFVTPYEQCVLVMPGTSNLKPGGTAVRLGRYED